MGGVYRSDWRIGRDRIHWTYRTGGHGWQREHNDRPYRTDGRDGPREHKLDLPDRRAQVAA